jgi:hypothetical protein
MMNVQHISATLRQQGFVVYTEPLRLNIVGIRADTTIPNKFDDTLFVFWKDASGQWQSHQGPATTDPGTYWLRSPMNPQGTAILKSGQYVDSHSLGLHRGKYTALVQTGSLTVIRDYDRDSTLDFNAGTPVSGRGFGINIHRASGVGESKVVDKYSAGCQVWANYTDFMTFINLCKLHESRHGNKFTYTLIDHRMEARASRRKKLYVVGGTVALAAIGTTAYLTLT